MSSLELVLLLVAILIFLLAIGMPVAFALIVSGSIGMAFFVDPSQIRAEPTVFWRSVNSYSLTAVPVFIFMAEILHHGRIAEDMYKSVSLWLGRIPGGAAYTNVFACAIFAALSGSSTANAAAIGAIACPTMIEQGYSRRLTFGSIAGAGTLGIMIPPSISFIIYGSLTGVSIGQLFLAGIIPGLILTVFFAFVILTWGIINPAVTPKAQPVKWKQRFKSLLWLIPPGLLVVAILGSIYGGLVTPSEAGVMGVAGALLLVLFTGRLTLEVIKKSLDTTVRMTSMILFIIVGAAIFTYVIGFLGTAKMLSSAIAHLGLPIWGVLALTALLYIILGMFVESVSLMILTIPIITPIMESLGVDLIWFGVFMVMLIEFGLITPPVGLNLYVLQGINVGERFGDIALGSAPFLIAMIACIILITIFPDIVLIVPSLMKGP